MHPADLTIAEAGAALRSGRLTCVELVLAHLDRIAHRNPAIQAFVALCPDRALELAKTVDSDLASGRDLGALQGIPFAVKDLIDVAGLPTRCGSHATSDLPAKTDAPAVARLVQAGAIPLGKVATYEFALTGPSFDGPFPPAINPVNPDHITGGSSSGSAAAVAAGMVRIALGTDTGGSLRSPSAFCGVVGLKPAFGAISMAGTVPLSPSLDHLGPVARTVAEAAAVMAAFGSVAGAGKSTALRCGYARDWFANDPATDPGCLALLDASVERLATSGVQITEVSLSEYALAEAAGAIILHAEALKQHLPRLQQRPDAYGKQARQSLAAGAGLTAEDIEKAREYAAIFKNEIDHLLTQFDAIVTITTLAPAPPISAFTNEQTVWTPMRTLPFNLSGHPAISVPIGRLRGLPVGGQIIGSQIGTICRLGMTAEHQ